MYKRRVKRTLPTTPKEEDFISPLKDRNKELSGRNKKHSDTVPEEYESAISREMSAVSNINTTQRNKKSYFEEVTVSCGFVFSTDTKSHSLSQDQTMFLRDLKTKLEGHSSFPDNIADFMKGFHDFCENTTNFEKSLKETESSKSSSMVRRPTQDSLIHLLLSVDCLQMKVTEYIGERLVEFVCSENGARRAPKKDYPWARMLLNQFKFLDNIVEPEAFLQLLFDILESVPASVKVDVLFCFPGIVQDSQHEETAKRMSTLLLQNFDLTPSILDTLTNLSLSADLRSTVGESVMKGLQSVPLEFLPKMVQFLVTDTIPDDVHTVVAHLRKHLDFTPLPWEKKKKSSSQAGPSGSSNRSHCRKGTVDTKSCEVLTIEVLKQSVLVFQPMAEAWLMAVKGVHTPAEHRPLDVMMLLVLYESVPAARPPVLALFRSKARSGLFREKLLDKTFASMLPVIKEYLSSLLEILYLLLQSPEPAVVHHASSWYKRCLLHLESFRAQEVVQRLLLYVGTVNAAAMGAVLNVMAELAEADLRALAPHQLLMLNMLDKLPDVDLSVAETILEVLCRLAFGPLPCHTGIDDTVLMVVRKQLASWNPVVKQKGVVGAVLSAKHMITRHGDADSSIEESNIKQAIQLLEMVTLSTQSCSQTRGVFLDKLSAVVCKAENLDEKFIEWINNYIGVSFEENYILKRKHVNVGEELKLMYNLEEEDDDNYDDDDDVCVGLAPLVDKAASQQRCLDAPILVMNASVRLVRCLKYLACEGDLADIAALLTCPVLMPRAVEQPEPDFLDPLEQCFLLDCMFHCTNWFRELLSAFTCQKDEDIRKNVLTRLENLVNLQKRLAHWLTQAINYVPPPCQFYAAAKVIKPHKKSQRPGRKKGAKRKRKSKKASKKQSKSNDGTEENGAGEDEEGGEEEEEKDDEETGTAVESDASKSFESAALVEYQGFLRELDVDVLVLVMEPLELRTGVAHSLSPPLLLFLLQDFACKVEHLLAPEAKRMSPHKPSAASASKPVGFANLETFDPLSFARNTIKLLKPLCTKLEAIAEYCQKLLKESDQIRDAPSMFPEGSEEIKLCYTYILRVLAGLFSWPGFQSSVHSSHLMDALKMIVARTDQTVAENGLQTELVCGALQYLQMYTERTLHLPAACTLVKLMSTIAQLAEEEKELSQQIADMCQNFLSQQWFTLKGSQEKGSDLNQSVDMLLKKMFDSVENKLQTTSDLITTVYSEMESRIAKKDWSLDIFPTITRSNFPLLYRSLCSALVLGTEELLAGNSKNTTTAQLKVWEVAVDSLRGLMMIARLQSSRPNLVAFVKNSLRLLKTFLKKGLPLLSRVFRRSPSNVTSLLQSLQKSTRFLNSVCYHSKATKDVSLTALVPSLRLVLEQIVVAVRGMLTQNSCGDAFWVGVLKNRNLQGEEVLSQQNESTAEEEQEELPSDDDSDVDVNLGEDKGEEEDQEDKGSSHESDIF